MKQDGKTIYHAGTAPPYGSRAEARAGAKVGGQEDRDMSEAEWRKIDEAQLTRIEDEYGPLTFRAPGGNQGQIVTVSYAGYPDGVIQRTHDGSDSSVSYRRRAWREADEEMVGLNRDAE